MFLNFTFYFAIVGSSWRSSYNHADSATYRRTRRSPVEGGRQFKNGQGRWSLIIPVYQFNCCMYWKMENYAIYKH